jgi:hypothetical protein
MEIHPSWSYLWDEFREDYVLLSMEKYRGKGLEHCLIFCKFDGTVMRIEDDELAFALKQRMQEAGVPIVYERPPVEFDINAKRNELDQTTADFAERQTKWAEVRRQYEELYQKRQQKLAELRAAKETRRGSVSPA